MFVLLKPHLKLTDYFEIYFLNNIKVSFDKTKQNLHFRNLAEEAWNTSNLFPHSPSSELEFTGINLRRRRIR